jgi:hypothetical protein
MTVLRGNKQHSCITLVDLDLYRPIKYNELVKVDAKFNIDVEYWASRNGL